MKRTKKVLLTLLVLLFSVVAIPTPTQAAGKTIKLSDSTVTMRIGERETVKLVNTSGKKAAWKSSNTAVAAVRSVGRVTAGITGKKAGTATITARFDGKTYKCRVTVKGAELSEKSMKLTVGMQTPTIKLENTAGSRKAVWSSSNTSVVQVKSAGRVTARLTARKAGTATVTAKFGSKTYKCRVKVYNPRLNVKSLSLTEGNKKTLKLDYVFGKNNVSWKSSDKSVASVKRTTRVQAELTAKSAGTATITAKIYGKTYSFKVTVNEKITTPTLSKEDVKIIVGKNTNLQLAGTTGTKKVEWTSSNPSVASVDGRSRTVGKVTAKKSGKAMITAEWGGKSYKCTVRVLQPEISDKNIRLTPGLSYDIWMDYVLERPDKERLRSIWTTATVPDFDLLKTDENVIWKSGNPAVVSVSKKNSDTATLTAKAIGTATITATVNGKAYKCKVKVISSYPAPTVYFANPGATLTADEIKAYKLASSHEGGWERGVHPASRNPQRRCTRIARLVAPTISYRYYVTADAEQTRRLGEEGMFYGGVAYGDEEYYPIARFVR